MSSRLIFRVKDGVAPSEVLPNTMLESVGEEIRVGRVHDIGNEVAAFRTTESVAAEIESDEELFNTAIYETKSEPEKNLYRTYFAEAGRDTAESLYESLQANENVEYVQYDEMNSLYVNPNDPRFGELWGIRKIECPAAWDTAQGNGVVVAVIDTGVDYNHPDIRDNMLRAADGSIIGHDFSNNDTDPMDFHGHGSHCAGTVAATMSNNIGVVGVAPRAKIMAVKVFPNAYDSVCANAIRYAADNGAKVLSNSWGPDNRRPTNEVVADAIVYAVSRGCIVVFAAGNENDDVQFYAPSNHPSVISVASVDANDRRAGTSNFGNLITIAAPGVSILSLRMGTNDYVLKSGTSMACPHVAGLVALLLGINGNLTLNQIKQNLRNNADAIQTDQPTSGRRINANRSVQALIAAPSDENGSGDGTPALETNIEPTGEAEYEKV